jgi:nicotinamidase-related amidase
MFRTFAIALLAASVLTAPVLAQNATAPAPGSADKSAPAAPAAVKTVKADRAVVKHVRHARHGHGTRMAKHVKHMKYAHHMKRHNVSTTTGAAAPAKQADTKPAAKSGAN